MISVLEISEKRRKGKVEQQKQNQKIAVKVQLKQQPDLNKKTTTKKTVEILDKCIQNICRATGTNTGSESNKDISVTSEVRAGSKHQQ